MKIIDIATQHYDELYNAESLRAKCRELAEQYAVDKTAIRKHFYKLRKEREHSALYDFADKNGFDASQVNHYWYKGKSISAHVKPEQITYDEIKQELIDELKNYSPKYPKLQYKKTSEPHLLLIDPADVHIGKLATFIETGDEYNTQIACERVINGVEGILNKAKGFDIDQILFVGGNDILHIDTPKRTTTSGTPQDTDGMWYENFTAAKEIYIKALETLVTVAPVHFVFNPSNHDYTNGFFLADVIQTWFRKHPNITFDCSISHRKYYRYYDNLIGTTHGDGAKQQDLPLLMANEAKVDWASSTYRYVYTHHVHHKTAKDFAGVSVESLRSPSGADSWHHRNGYQHAPKAIEGFIHSRDKGQIARLTHYFV